MKIRPCLPTLIAFTFQLHVAAALSPKEVAFFEQKIRPVLAEACYECHNSVDKAKGDIALDWRDAMVASEIIVPGKPEKSTLIQAIRHADGYEPMPSKKPRLAKLIVKNFEDWVRMGAPDPRDTKPSKEDLASQVDWDAVRDQRTDWWRPYQAIKATQAPAVQGEAWQQHPIDRFVKARLDAAGVSPQPPASPEVLIRRLYLTLHGVPPPPEVVTDFTRAPSPVAYAKLVDDLLADERFGERWGRYWLDWFRYAESHGSEGDPAIPYASVYRDYVVRALNADVPYDQLIREHIAGDLLEQPRLNEELGLNESAIGPGHYRMVPHGFGVTDAYAEQIAFTDNQVDVVTKAILGSTLSCARCHNHKFDPLSQKDYYKFYGMMISSRPGIINVDHPRLQSLHRNEIPALKVDLRTALAKHWQTQVDAVMGALDKKKKLKEAATKDEGHPLHAWYATHARSTKEVERAWQTLQEKYQARLRQKAEGIESATFYADLRDQATYDSWFKNGSGLGDKVSPAGSFAIASEGERALTGIYPRGIYTHLVTDKDNATLSSIFHRAKGNYTAIRAVGNNATTRFSVRNYPLMHGGLHPTPGVKPTFSWIPQKKYSYWNDEKIYYQLTTGADQTYRTGKGRGWFGVTEVYGGEGPLPEVGHPAFALPNAPRELADTAAVHRFYRASIATAIEAWANGEATDAQVVLLNSLREHGMLDDRLAALPTRPRQLVERYRSLEKEIRVPVRAAGVIEGEPWDQPLLGQGLYKNEEEEVPRGFLEAFGGRTYSKTSSGRRELAEDLLAPNNPLTARVIVNRLWHHTFGRGIVADTDNFGRLGKPPSHPELLDYLANEFRGSQQWSIKAMLRALVTSRTFQSGSETPAGVAERDPDNTLLAYFSPRRLDAEAILDTLRALSGNSGQAAIYRASKRNNLDGFLTAFNFPIPTSTVGARDLTNVPAQSLMMMNGNEARGAAQRWAQRIERDRSLDTTEKQIEALFLQAYSRPPRPEEVAACMQFLSGKTDDGALNELIVARDTSKQRVDQLQAARTKLLAPTRAKLQQAVDARNAAAQQAAKTEKPVDLKPIARWDFEGNAQDAIGSLHGTIKGRARIENGALVLEGGGLYTPPIDRTIKTKTFEVLVQLSNTRQRGGGAMTLQDLQGNVFDGMVYGEIRGKEWLAGSDHHRRTKPFNGPNDDQGVQSPVRMIMVFDEDGSSTAYRDGKPYGQKIRMGPGVTYAQGKAQIVFGQRHGTTPNGARALHGKIHEARLYDRALTPEEIAAASSGLLLEFVRDQEVIDALPQEQREQLAAIEAQLAPTREALTAQRKQVAAQEAARNGIPGGLTRLTHALINSKELIYVY